MLLFQRAEPDHAAVLLSSMPPVPGNPVLLQAMFYLPARVSTADLIALLLRDLQQPFACRARRLDQVFPAHQTAPIANGDSIELDVMRPMGESVSDLPADDLALLQTGKPQIRPTPVRPHGRKVEVRLEAHIPPPARPASSPLCPEILFTTDCPWS